MDNTQVKVENLANYYVLPLLALNKASFGTDNFINSFVTHKGEIVIEVEDLNKVPQAIMAHVRYLTDLEVEDRKLIFFKLSMELQDTLTKFAEGKYSEFSESAKKLIRQYCGLPYKANVSGQKEPYTADLLKVLDKDPELRARMEDDLGARIEKTAELKSKPSETNFLNY